GAARGAGAVWAGAAWAGSAPNTGVVSSGATSAARNRPSSVTRAHGAARRAAPAREFGSGIGTDSDYGRSTTLGRGGGIAVAVVVVSQEGQCQYRPSQHRATPTWGRPAPSPRRRCARSRART